MRRFFIAAPGRATVLMMAVLVWVLVRFCYDQITWHARETTLDSLFEGQYRVIRVIDWRTVLLTPTCTSPVNPGDRPSANTTQRAQVRLIGVSAPAVFSTGRPTDPMARQQWQDEAFRWTGDFVSEGTVRLRLDRRRIDPSRVFLAYLFVGDRLLNEELVRAGLARIDVRPRDSSTMVRRLRQAQIEARDSHRGIWANPARVVTFGR